VKAVDRLAVKLAQVQVKAYVRREGGKFEQVERHTRGLQGILGKKGLPTPAPRPLKGSPGRRVQPPTFSIEQRERAQLIEKRVDEAKAKGLETTQQFAVQVGEDEAGDPLFVWDPKRERQHKEVIDHFWSQEFDGVPSEGKAVVSGGIGGAGKSTILKKHADIDREAYGTVNPDDIKEYMAAHGMTPKIAGLDPMEASALIHEESSYLAKLLAQRAYDQKKNMIWDITMASQRSVQSRVDALHKYGYSEIKGVFVDIPVELSVQRAIGRWWKGHTDPENKIGGRYVPPALIRKQAAQEGSTKNRRVFDSFRPKFDSWEVWSTESPTPRQVASSKGVPKT
jgi:predicted ABC-type ATPase